MMKIIRVMSYGAPGHWRSVGWVARERFSKEEMGAEALVMRRSMLREHLCLPGRENSEYEWPEVEISLAHTRNRKKVSVM